MVKLIVFDWDGTLMDSEAQIVSCMKKAIDDMQWPVRTTDEIRNIIGLGLKEAVAALFPAKNMTVVQALADRYRFHFLAEPSHANALFDGAEQVVQQCYADGYLLAVATGKGRQGLDKVLIDSNLGQFFHITRCADETISKPHPQMLQEIMSSLDVSPDETIMVGDTEYDLQMATNADVASVAVSYGVHDASRLALHKPLAMLDDIRQLLDILPLTINKVKMNG